MTRTRILLTLLALTACVPEFRTVRTAAASLEADVISTLDAGALGPVRIGGSGIDIAAPTLVRFSNDTFRIDVPAIALSEASVLAVAPPYFAATDGFDTGVVSVQLIQTRGSGTRSSVAFTGFTIRPPDPPGPLPGALVWASLRAARLALQADLGALPGNPIDTPRLRVAMRRVIGDLAGLERDVAALAAGATTWLPLGTLRGQPIGLTRSDLATADRMLVTTLRRLIDMAYGRRQGSATAPQGTRPSVPAVATLASLTLISRSFAWSAPASAPTCPWQCLVHELEDTVDAYIRGDTTLEQRRAALSRAELRCVLASAMPVALQYTLAAAAMSFLAVPLRYAEAGWSALTAITLGAGATQVAIGSAMDRNSAAGQGLVQDGVKRGLAATRDGIASGVLSTIPGGSAVYTLSTNLAELVDVPARLPSSRNPGPCATDLTGRWAGRYSMAFAAGPPCSFRVSDTGALLLDLVQNGDEVTGTGTIAELTVVEIDERSCRVVGKTSVDFEVRGRTDGSLAELLLRICNPDPPICADLPIRMVLSPDLALGVWDVPGIDGALRLVRM